MKLSELLAGIAPVQDDVVIGGLALDSRNIKPGDVFLAVAGSQAHGLQHAQPALQRGAAAIVYESAAVAETLMDGSGAGVPRIPVDGLREKLGEIAARFYADPSTQLRVIGVTGTNGKTSCSQFLAQALGRCGVVGTLGWGLPGQLRLTQNTTPDAVALQAMFADLLAMGCAAVAMEVSSHALEQSRVNGVHFYGAVFTNISRDHLDYHRSMEAYLAAKLRLLEKPGLRFVAVNLDDAYAPQILAAAPYGVALIGYTKAGASIQTGQPMELLVANTVRQLPTGLELTVTWRGQQAEFTAPVFGEVNAENLLATLAALLAMGMALSEAGQRLAHICPVPGRMQRVAAPDAPTVFVDYAHTPDALDKVLAGMRQHCPARLWVVFGCGGDRDPGKRPEMGQAAVRWAHRVVLTDDNPRSENPDAIIGQILAGCGATEVEVRRDRRQAIHFAVMRADSDDWVLVAGKGHEDYQEINGHKLPFSDTAVVEEALRQRGGTHAHTA